jgi:transcriptional regulator with XRE-family HTH domain
MNKKGGWHISNNLKVFRDERKLSGIDVANYLNISPQFYYDLEKGRRTLTQEYLEKLSDFYNTTIDSLLDRIKKETEPSFVNDAEQMYRVDPELFTEMCRAKSLPEEDRVKVREYAALLIEKRLREKKSK